MSMRILVTGASGFLGQNIVPVLVAAGHHVLAMTRDTSSPLAHSDAVERIVADLNRPDEQLRSVIAACDGIIHLAADTTPRSSAGSILADAQGSLLPTLNLLDLIQSNPGPKLFVYASSGGTVYGHPQTSPIEESHPTLPTSPYGVGKLTCEHMIRLVAESRGLRHVILRISNPYGPHQHARRKQGVIGAWIKAALADDTVEMWGDGSVIRDYIYVQDVAAAFLSVLENPPPSDIYNLGSGKGATLLEIARLIELNLGRPLKIERKPMSSYDVGVNILCVKKLCAAIHWSAATSLPTGIASTITWMARYSGVSDAGSAGKRQSEASPPRAADR